MFSLVFPETDILFAHCFHRLILRDVCVCFVKLQLVLFWAVFPAHLLQQVFSFYVLNFGLIVSGGLVIEELGLILLLGHPC